MAAPVREHRDRRVRSADLAPVVPDLVASVARVLAELPGDRVAVRVVREVVQVVPAVDRVRVADDELRVPAAVDVGVVKTTSSLH